MATQMGSDPGLNQSISPRVFLATVIVSAFPTVSREMAYVTGKTQEFGLTFEGET